MGPSGGPPLANGKTGRGVPTMPTWPSMFWRFSLPTQTACWPLSSTMSPPRSVDARVMVAPLGGQQVDDVHALGSRLQEGRGRCQEVDVRVAADPRPCVGRERRAEPDLEPSAAERGLGDRDDLRRDVHAAHDLEGRACGGDVDAELAGHVGIAGIAEHDARRRGPRRWPG